MMSTSVCQSVCLSVHPSVKISLKPHMRSFPIFLCMLPMAMAQSSGRVMKGERAVLGVFFLIDNALYRIAFGTHTKTAEPIEMPFGMRLG